MINWTERAKELDETIGKVLFDMDIYVGDITLDKIVSKIIIQERKMFRKEVK